MTESEVPLIKQFLRHQSEFMAYLMAITRDFEASEEIFQNAAVVVMERSIEPNEPLRDFRAWAKEVVRRQAFAYLQAAERKRAKTVAMQPELLDQITSVFLDANDQTVPFEQESLALRTCISEMEARQRQVLELRYGQQKSFAQIADIVDKTEAAVQRSVSRIRKRLYDCVQMKLSTSG